MAEREARWRGGIARRTYDYVVTQLYDRDRIRAILRPRSALAAYALGQLEPGLFERTRWFFARGDTGTGIVLHARGGLGEASFTMGDPDAIAAIVSIHPGPAHTYTTCEPQHLGALQRMYRLGNAQPMVRMSVTRETFRPLPSTPTTALTGHDIRRVNTLYASDGAPSYYVPDHIENGMYRGIFVDGRLVAVAGTHVISRQEGVAVVGNVFTHPAYRRRGYAEATTSAVTAALLECCEFVALTVDPRNDPAVRAYQRLGYVRACELVEASASRYALGGVSAGLRRWRANSRGRRYGGAFVSLRPS